MSEQVKPWHCKDPLHGDDSRWRKHRINQSFIDNLEMLFHRNAHHQAEHWKDAPYAYFTNHMAYNVYFNRHANEWQKPWTSPDDYWLRVNVRQYLSHAVVHGIIHRIQPGVYTFHQPGTAAYDALVAYFNAIAKEN